MVRIRYSDSVKIQISGVKSIIPRARIEIGRRSMTWLTFLNEVCKIELDSDKKYFICTSGYSPNHSVEGLTANLSDKIDQIVVNFTKKLRKYCVRLHRGCRPIQKKNNIQPGNKQIEARPKISSPGMCASPVTSSPLKKPMKTLVARKFATIVPIKPSQLAKLLLPQPEAELSILKSPTPNCQDIMVAKSNETQSIDDSGLLEICETRLLGNDHLDDKIRECNTPQIVKSKLPEKNLEGDNLVEKFEQQVDMMDHGMLEQICKEIKKLRQTEQWDRNLKRSPFACGLLWEICKK